MLPRAESPRYPACHWRARSRTGLKTSDESISRKYVVAALSGPGNGPCPSAANVASAAAASIPAWIPKSANAVSTRDVRMVETVALWSSCDL